MAQVPQESVSIRPIGVVVSAFKDFDQKTNYEAESMIQIREDLEAALTGLEEYSHIHVLYHQHRRKEWQQAVGWTKTEDQILTMDTPEEPFCKGIYTTRSPARPSGIGSCIAELVRREGNKLYLKGLDAFNGTSVLDIKIYVPRYDCFPFADLPLQWCSILPVKSTSRMLHWDSMNVSLALGMRAGLKALQVLGINRGEAAEARVVGGNFFVQGVEGVTGCSVLHDNLSFTEQSDKIGVWYVRLTVGERTVTVQLNERLYTGADEVLCLSDDVLFASVS
ncbi:TPA: hypothetical protein DDW35_07425 [Candidatus Sumerlaeota bacterium]|jgi:tRNA (adenine37-N6)-methyltransferase|nr:hypothetical protein [Candidatus Sumerlaeota bacterium]